jgi:hypothetical protein
LISRNETASTRWESKARKKFSVGPGLTGTEKLPFCSSLVVTDNMSPKRTVHRLGHFAMEKVSLMLRIGKDLTGKKVTFLPKNMRVTRVSHSSSKNSNVIEKRETFYSCRFQRQHFFQSSLG